MRWSRSDDAMAKEETGEDKREFEVNLENLN
jgi:hypothetical protein